MRPEDHYTRDVVHPWSPVHITVAGAATTQCGAPAGVPTNVAGALVCLRCVEAELLLQLAEVRRQIKEERR